MSFKAEEIAAQMDAEGFGRWLRGVRESMGLEKKELAARCRIRPGSLGDLELGHRAGSSPTIELFARLAQGLNVELGFVLYKAGYDIGKGGVDMERLARLEDFSTLLMERAPEMRRAMAEAMLELEKVPARSAVADERVIEAGNRLGHGLAALDAVTERFREERGI